MNDKIFADTNMVKYQFSYWDSLILAAALESGCIWLYSEDLQDGQQIENTLTIRNPFLQP
jgi:predicted nucleic acid-binding protein